MDGATTVLALTLLLGLQPVTTDLYLPALPLLAHDMAAPMSAVQLTMSVLLLAFGLAQLLAGPLSDRFGRRPVLLLGLSLYTLASVAAMLAPDMVWLIVARAGQGVGLAASVVCARAMVRDLHEPYEGARVMSRGLSGLGVIAMLSPTVGGLLTAFSGWRASLAAVTLVGLLSLLFVWRRVPETAARLNPHALAWEPLLRSFLEVARHPTFRAWTALVASTYGGLYVLLAGSSFVYIGHFGLPASAYGLTMASASLSYLGGTFYCRRLLGRVGLSAAVRQGAWFSLTGGLGMLGLCLWLKQPPLWGVVLAQWFFSFGHGIHQPCGQSGAVGAFPRMAGVASALSGFVLALAAFVIGLWMGRAMDGSPLVMASGVATSALLITLVVWTLVRQHGERFSQQPA